jgi:predicted RNA binding protein YcfA (HicA-like mRNA interferase family)
MSRYGNISYRDLVALATEYGYKKIRHSGSHAIYTNGSKCVVIPIHKGKSLGKGLAIRIINQIKHN